VVQDPDEATFSSMPTSALKRDHVNYSVKLSEMGRLLNTLIRDSESHQIAGGSMNPEGRYTSTDLTCPECRGPLSERQDGALTELRCRVGHIYSLESAIATHVETQERTLWSAVVALEEGAELFRKTAAQSEGSQAGRLINEAKSREANAKLMREMLERFNDQVL
jgi:two-component system, chemotaxis family, protein-glutamate methylesterase/glutaminase